MPQISREPLLGGVIDTINRVKTMFPPTLRVRPIRINLVEWRLAGAAGSCLCPRCGGHRCSSMAAGPSQPAWPRGCGQLLIESRCAAPSPSSPSLFEWHSLLFGARCAVPRSSSSSYVGKRGGESEAPIFGLQWIGSRLQQVNYVSGHGDLCPTRARTTLGSLPELKKAQPAKRA